MQDIINLPLSFLEYYHQESVQNPFYSTPQKIEKQKEILGRLRQKGGIGEDKEVAVKQQDMKYFSLN